MAKVDTSSFRITIQCADDNIFKENECAVATSGSITCGNLNESNFSCPSGSIVGNCNDQGSWTCNECPRQTDISLLEEYTEPGISCQTQCIPSQNTPELDSDGYIFYAQYTSYRDYDANNPPTYWPTSLTGLYEIPTRCATCWVAGLGYVFAHPSNATTFLKCAPLASQAKCPIDTYSTGVELHSGYDYCVACPNGLYASGTGTSVDDCRACRENSYINNHTGECVQCPDPLQTTQGVVVVTGGIGFCVCPYTYVSTNNNTVCLPCPENHLCSANVPGKRYLKSFEKCRPAFDDLLTFQNPRNR